jgi:peptidoglycan hydrolase-like protein with peptidoglycan-binding domain
MSPRHPSTRVLAVALLLVGLSVAAMAGPAAALTTDYPTLGRGNRGVDVKALQHLLRAQRITIAVRLSDEPDRAMYERRTVVVDGVFGASTDAAVRELQRRRGLTVTGRVDAKTWAESIETARPGDRGEVVAALQRLLIEKRKAKIDLSATFDGATKSAVVAFQRHVGIDATGTVGAGTWRRLLAHLELPVWGSTLCSYEVGNGSAKWGTSEAIGQLQAAARRVVDGGHGKVGLGDIGWEHGGDIPLHQTHEQGLDVDLRPMRDARDQCRWGVRWDWGTYDRAATRDLIRAIRATAPGHVKLIYFTDPVLIREGLTTWFAGHDDHLHVRYCEVVHPLKAYDC